MNHNLLYFLSKTDPSLIFNCDHNSKHTQLARGFFVLTTALLWGGGTLYTMNMVYPGKWLISAPIALILALLVMYVDREIVAAIGKHWTAMLLRFCFCLLIGYAISIPFKLEMFRHEIEKIIAHREDKKNSEIRLEIDERKAYELNKFNTSIDRSEGDFDRFIKRSEDYKSLMRREESGFDCEDGQCTGDKGRGPAFEDAKNQAAYYEIQAARIRTEIDSLKTERAAFEADIEAEFLARTANKGWG